MNNAVFLDRDGTINYEPFRMYLNEIGIVDIKKYINKKEYDHYKFVKKISDLIFLPNSFKALEKLAETEYKIIVVTNQRGVNEGYISKRKLEKQNSFVVSEVKKEGGRIDRVYYCPHRKNEGCRCRKPSIGMLEQAVKEFAIDLKQSWVVGDSTADIQLGKNASCKTILVKTGWAGQDRTHRAKPDFTAQDLLEAAEIIIN